MSFIEIVIYMTLLTPNKLLPWKIKTALGFISKKPVMRRGEVIKIADSPLCDRDLFQIVN